VRREVVWSAKTRRDLAAIVIHIAERQSGCGDPSC